MGKSHSFFSASIQSVFIVVGYVTECRLGDTEIVRAGFTLKVPGLVGEIEK